MIVLTVDARRVLWLRRSSYATIRWPGARLYSPHRMWQFLRHRRQFRKMNELVPQVDGTECGLTLAPGAHHFPQQSGIEAVAPDTRPGRERASDMSNEPSPDEPHGAPGDGRFPAAVEYGQCEGFRSQ